MRFSGIDGDPGERRIRFRWMVGVLLFLLVLGVSERAHGAEFEEVEQQFIEGQYADAIEEAEQVVSSGGVGEEWRALLVRSLMLTGQYTNALDVMTTALRRYPRSVKLRVLARDVYRSNGEVYRGELMIQEINQLAGRRMWAYQDPENLVALGRAAVILGADPRRVLEQFYDRAKKAEPELRDVYLASGELALSKNDYALAARAYGEGLKKFPDDPDMNYGLARSFAPSDRRQMIGALAAALEANTNHVGSFLLMVDHLIDSEDYAAAEETLEQVLDVDPWQPSAWAYQAVLEHLRSSQKGEARSRDNAMRFWPSNPEVDHLIGRKLSQKYRFKEGAAYQRQALAMDRNYLPARIQLAQDLLRLGDEAEGWKLADQVNELDGYNVAAFNLVTLQETIDQFQTLTNQNFILRMGKEEAEVWGEEALTLLQDAKDHLCEKYGIELERPTTVEIFPKPEDFGIRTFGIPDNPGFLGVCFGSVITANSPSSQTASPANWKAVLWHEFCHVVTLQMTRNKMPRWLSEGISVHEELEANSTWGQTMNPRYRQMITEGELTPVGELSGAFLAPRSEMHLQFAYYESALVVEFLIDRYGLESLQNILRDLGEGKEINQAIADRCAPLAEIEEAFEKFAVARAEALGPELKWDVPEREELSDPNWRRDNLDNYYALQSEVGALMLGEQWEDALGLCETLIERYPDQTDPGNAYAILATIYRKQGNVEKERETLATLGAKVSDDLDVYSRLMTLWSEGENWEAVARNAERYLAVNPLRAQPYQFLGLASEKLGDDSRAIDSYRTLLKLDAPDPADAHFRLARLLHKRGDAGAKRHLLQALEEAPRYRDAHRLLLEMRRDTNKEDEAVESEGSPARSSATVEER